MNSGVWNVPFISGAVLLAGSWVLDNANDLPSYSSDEWEPDMAFCSWMREKVSTHSVGAM